MKIFFSEYLNDYSTYTFSYAVYCLPEAENETALIYQKGFLPFTAKLSFKKDIFYLARSVRINLENFSDTSENRRVNNIIAKLDNIEIYITKKEDFTINQSFIDFCVQFAEERFTGGNMNRERLNYLLGRKNLTHIITFKSPARTYAYVLSHISGEMLHYWFAFYDTDFINYSLGKWIMWRTISLAKEQGLQYVYLGTCYTPKGMYKVRDHKGAGFFDGAGWNQDLKLLKKLCENDVSGQNRADLFKYSDPDVESIFK
jgi:hypothetical protein